jgi:probable rRNA maturation factor
VKRPLLLVGVIALVIVIGAVAFARRGPARTTVDVGAAVRQAQFRSTVTASGEIVASEYADIGSSVMGKITALPVAEPAPDAPGETLIVIGESTHAVDVARWEALARNVLQHEGVRGQAELALLFVDEATMAELNGTFMGQQGPTDVLAFPIDADDEIGVGRSPDGSTTGPDRDPPSDLPMLLGDVVVCPAVAARNAPTHAGTYDDELALLIVHGILHVLGHDHAEPEETTRMQSRERDLLDRYHRSDP